MSIQPIDSVIKKRNISFLSQLVTNKLTSQLVIEKETGSPVEKMLDSVGFIDSNDLVQYKLANIYGKCMRKINQMKMVEKFNQESNLTTAVSYLINHRSQDNDETLKYILKAEHGLRGK